jgi:hypothetical protein
MNFIKKLFGKADIMTSPIVGSSSTGMNFTLVDGSFKTSKSGYAAGATFNATATIQGSAPKNKTWVLRLKTDCDNYDKSHTVTTGESCDFKVKTNGMSDTKITIYISSDDASVASSSGNLHIEY